MHEMNLMNNRFLQKIESNSEVLNKGELQRCVDPEIFSGLEVPSKLHLLLETYLTLHVVIQ